MPDTLITVENLSKVVHWFCRYSRFGVSGQYRTDILDYRAQLKVARLPLRHSVSWFLLVQFGLYVSPCRVRLERHPRGAAATLFPQPNGQWSAFPLVHSRRPTPLYLPDLAVSVVVAGLFLWFGIHRLLKTGEALPTLFEFSLGRHSRRFCHSVRTRGRNFTVDCAQAR